MGSLTVFSSAIKSPASSVDQPSKRKHILITADPQTIKGRRRPHLHFEWSESAPINGCINPNEGLTIHTRETLDLATPSFKRYGVKSALPNNSANS